MAKSKKPNAGDNDVRATYLIPSEIKQEVDREAQASDLSASQVARKIFRDWFRRKTAPRQGGSDDAAG